LISGLNLEAVSSVLSGILPSYMQPKLGYVNEDYSQQVNEITQGTTRWYAIYFITALNLSCTIIFILIYRYRKYLKAQKNQLYEIFELGLFLGIFANIMYHIPSGSRFMIFHNYLAITMFIMLLLKVDLFKDYKIKLYMNSIKYMLIFYCVIQVWLGMDAISPLTIFGNPFLTYIIEMKASVKSIFKSILS
jgi:hypothetical protein